MDDDGEIIQKKQLPINNSLWVDKYTSKKFFDLLTDEITNRNVLTWLKTWDEIVFPSNPKVNLKIPEHILHKSNHNSGSALNLPTNPGAQAFFQNQ